jgi:hypothetical protein
MHIVERRPSQCAFLDINEEEEYMYIPWVPVASPPIVNRKLACAKNQPSKGLVPVREREHSNRPGAVNHTRPASTVIIL